MKQKKGFFLAEETLKMILAVIAIGFLAYLLFSLYNSQQNAKELDLATRSLDFLNQEIEKGTNEIMLQNPNGWVLLSWPYTGESARPDSCDTFGWESCICIVEDIGLVENSISVLPFTQNLRERFIKRSDDGVCSNNPQGLVVKQDGIQQRPILIDGLTTLNVDYGNKIVQENKA